MLILVEIIVPVVVIACSWVVYQAGYNAGKKAGRRLYRRD